MTLVQMRYFYEVCQWQNITKAAEQLHVSQPTVTVAMQAIETETGLNLFHREGRKITVTSDGAKLLSKISFILGEVTRLDDEIRDMAHRHAKVRIAMPLQLGVVFLPYLLGEFHEALDRYLARDFKKAGKMFMNANKLNPADEASLVFAERCKDYLKHGIPDDWDGVMNMTTK